MQHSRRLSTRVFAMDAFRTARALARALSSSWRLDRRERNAFSLVHSVVIIVETVHAGIFADGFAELRNSSGGN